MVGCSQNASRHCYLAGYVASGAVTWDPRHRGGCSAGPTQDRVWFNVDVKTTGHRVRVYLDNILVTSPTPYFRPTARAGVLTLTGFENIVYFSDITMRPRWRDPGKLDKRRGRFFFIDYIVRPANRPAFGGTVSLFYQMSR